jgi:hypothetical protein
MHEEEGMKPVIEKLSTGAHKAQGTDNQACIMELVSVLANEPWSDRPACASPAITSFCIWINDSGTQAHRDKLLLLAPKIVGTKDYKKDPARAQFFAEYAKWCSERAAKSAAESAEWAAKWAARSAEWAAESAARSAAESAESAEYAARSAEYAAESAESAEYAAKSAVSAESAEWAKIKTIIFDKAIEALERVLAV